MNIKLFCSHPDKELICHSNLIFPFWTGRRFCSLFFIPERLGINPEWIGLSDRAVFSNAEKISRFSGPTLMVHGEYDQIIPVAHARDLYDRSPAERKKLHIIKNADHNTLMMVGGRTYFEIIRDFILNSDTEKPLASVTVS